MKMILLTFAITAASLSLSHAETTIALSEVPETVTKAIAEYFPNAKALSAKRDTDDGKTQFEVRIQYKEIKLGVDVSPQGKILDVDQEN